MQPTQIPSIADARRIFEAATDASGAERQRLLDCECRSDDSLRSLVEQMLEADEQVQPVLDQPGGLAGAASGRGKLNAGDFIGEYRVVREIGSGGMGTVYQAEKAPGAEFVAIKVVRWNSHEIAKRFEQEQSILSGLRHANIARLLATGFTDRDYPYFVMEYVEGDPIDLYCLRTRRGVEGRVQLFRQVCAAVMYLHQHLVIHRDLKPGNVLVTADGAVKLVDFGIAKLLDAPSSSANTIAGLMTPDYASPEQIRGKATSTLTDVYALGLLLYELLAGRRPFEPKPNGLHETLRQVCEDEPLRPSVAGSNKELSGELDTIILKALRKEPDERYASVEQLDEDLRRHLARQPVLAQGDSVGYRAAKFVARHRGPVTAAAAMLVVGMAGVAGIGIEARIAQQERHRAEAHARAADFARAQAEAERGRAENERIRAENKAAEAGRERSNAERRLRELQNLAHGLVATYRSAKGDGAYSHAGMAGNVRNALLILGQERQLDAGMRDVLVQTEELLGITPARGPQLPAGWDSWQTQQGHYSVSLDRIVVHGGRSSVLLRSIVSEPEGRVHVGQRFSASRYTGKRIRLTGFLRTENASFAEFFLRPGDGSNVRRTVAGTTAWTRYEMVTDVPEHGESIQLGIELSGVGKVWADDLAVDVVDRSVPITSRDAENLTFTK